MLNHRRPEAKTPVQGQDRAEEHKKTKEKSDAGTNRHQDNVLLIFK